MTQQTHARTRVKPAELLLVPMIDIFTVLVTFLLMTAVFSRITILELDLPSADSGKARGAGVPARGDRPQGGPRAHQRQQLIAAIPNVNGEYDLKTLSELALSLKRDYPETDNASVLLEPDIEYDHLIQVMDAIRTADAGARRPGRRRPDAPSESRAADAEARPSGPVHGHRRWRCAMSVLVPSRSKMKHSLHHRVDAELNLIPLIDIMSVMVAFLLVYSADVEIVQNTKGVEIPQSIAEVKPKQSVVVMITKDQLFVQGELVANMRRSATRRSRLIEPLRAVLERPMLVDADAGGDEMTWLASREITVIADKSLPYDVREEGDGDLHGGRLRQDLAGRHREGATGSQRRTGDGVAATRPYAASHWTVSGDVMEAHYSPGIRTASRGGPREARRSRASSCGRSTPSSMASRRTRKQHRCCRTCAARSSSSTKAAAPNCSGATAPRRTTSTVALRGVRERLQQFNDRVAEIEARRRAQLDEITQSRSTRNSSRTTCSRRWKKRSARKHEWIVEREIDALREFAAMPVLDG